MRLLSARLIISLIVGITLVSLCTSAYQVVVTRRQMRRDLDRRAEVLGESLASNVEHDLERDAQRTLQPLMESAPPIVLQSLKDNHDTKAFLRMGIASIHIYARPLHSDDTLIGSLAIVHDTGY